VSVCDLSLLIGIDVRFFLEIVLSSARSLSSAASPLPSQFLPLLGDALEQVKDTIARVVPMEKCLSALEEAEYEDIGGEEGALEKEMLMQGEFLALATKDSDMVVWAVTPEEARGERQSEYW